MMNRKFLGCLLIFCVSKINAQTAIDSKFHDNDTLIYESYRIKPGDTLELGFGSGANKEFVFITFYGSVINATQATMPAIYSNHPIVYDHMIHKGKGYYPVFYLDGNKKTVYRYLVDFGNAVMANEIQLKK